MKLNLTLEDCKKLAAQGEYGLIPVSTELFADICTPMEVVRILKKVSSHVFLLESADSDKRWGRYSFLGYDPLLEITCYDGAVKMKTPLTAQTTREDIRSCIRNIVRENRSPELGAMPPFTGGLVGYFSYDYIKYSEPELKLDAKDEEGFRDVNLMLFHKVVAFDNDRHKIQLIVNVRTDDLETNYNRAVLELEEMKQLLRRGEKAPRNSLKLKSDFRPLFSKENYCRMVEKGKHYIKEGDIFQVVLSNWLEADMEGSLLDAYRVLRIQNPSPYMFYFSGAADCLEALGVNISVEPEKAEELLREAGICFLFAQKYHTAMKYVGPVRKELGIRTVFNILGPLTNPARACMQVMGVYDESLLEPMAKALSNLGVKKGMVVYGCEKLDEISICGPTSICCFKEGKIRMSTITPESAGLKRGETGELLGGTPAENAAITRAILEGRERGAKRDAAVLNAAAALLVAGKADSLAKAVKLTEETIDSGRALRKLEQFVALSNR